MSGAKTFHLFSKLPDEIKCKIWQHEIHRCRIIAIHTFHDMYVIAPKAPALSVNKLSRAEALKAYTRVAAGKPEIIYRNPTMSFYNQFNLDKDFFFFSVDTLFIDFGSTRQIYQNLELIRHLVVEDTTWSKIVTSKVRNGHYFLAICASLETVTVLTKNGCLCKNAARAQHVICSGDKAEQVRVCNDDVVTKEYFASLQVCWDEAIAGAKKIRREAPRFQWKDKNWEPPTELRLGYFSGN
jgi:hypothetical protein